MTVVLTTNEGLLFLVIGNAVGAALSPDPVLADGGVVSAAARPRGRFRHRHGDERTRGGDSPLPMISWAAVIVMLLIVSALPYFLGLVVTLPVLGHATWHLYRRLVVPVT
jgi:hypothetical protein